MRKINSPYVLPVAFSMLAIAILVTIGVPYLRSYEWYEIVPYGEHPSQVMEIGVPKAYQDTPTPAVIYIHGGGWAAGDKSNYRYLRDATIASGYRYVSLNYRLVGEGADYLDMLHDIDYAIDYLVFEAETYGIDLTRTVLVGGSAGAHLALLYAYKETPSIPIQFVMAYVPPVDFLDPSIFTMENAEEVVGMINGVTGTSIHDISDLSEGYPASWVDASPITHVDTAIPTLIAYGGQDELIPASNVPRLTLALQASSIVHEAVCFPHSGHNLADDPEQSEEMNALLNEWFTTYLPALLTNE